MVSSRVGLASVGVMLNDANNAYNANNGHLAAGSKNQMPSCELDASGQKTRCQGADSGS